MKAQDYYEMFPPKQFEEAVGDSEVGLDTFVTELFKTFNQEAADILTARHIKKNSAVASVITELNQKWNALNNMYEVNLGVSPIKKNGYLNAWVLELPELKPYVTKTKR